MDRLGLLPRRKSLQQKRVSLEGASTYAKFLITSSVIPFVAEATDIAAWQSLLATADVLIDSSGGMNLDITSAKILQGVTAAVESGVRHATAPKLTYIYCKHLYALCSVRSLIASMQAQEPGFMVMTASTLSRIPPPAPILHPSSPGVWEESKRWSTAKS